MFYTYDYLHKQPANRLNKHLLYFFKKLRLVDEYSAFRIDGSYFHPEFVSRLNRSKELADHFKLFFDVYKVLLPLEKSAVLKQFDNIQAVDKWLSNVYLDSRRIENDNLPQILRKPCKDLFQYLYEKTIKNDLARHYSELHQKLPSKYCPFCGIFKLPSPAVRKADYDHWLSKKDYPLLAVNMRNLIPICERCNQSYKKEQNVLVSTNGQRRVFLNPFKQSYAIRLNLAGSILPDGADNRNSQWIINFTPLDDIVQNWSDVFCIKERYADELREEFNHWLSVFIRDYSGKIHNINDLQNAFSEHGAKFTSYLYNQANLIRYGLFSFLSVCGDQEFYNATLKRLHD